MVATGMWKSNQIDDGSVDGTVAIVEKAAATEPRLRGSQRRAAVDSRRVVQCFGRYLSNAGLRISRAEFEANLSQKLSDPRFLEDISPLIAPGCAWDGDDAARYVQEELLAHLPGESWKSELGGSRGDR